MILPTIIVILGLTSIIIVYIQLAFWVGVSKDNTERVFDSSVSAAVAEMTKSLNQAEMEKMLSSDSTYLTLLNKLDSINNILNKLEQKYPNIQSDQDNSANLEDYINNSLSKEPCMQENDKHTYYDKLIRYRDHVITQDGLINNFVLRLKNYRSYYSFGKRVDINILDSILREKIKERGINSSLQFGVYSQAGKKLIHITDSVYKKDIETSKYIYELFPYDVFGKEKTILKLYFPDKLNYYIYKIMQLYIGFIILGIFIVFSYFYTIITIYKQNKIAIIKDDFVNNMTHELKTPVSTSSLVIDMLSDPSFNMSKEQYDSSIQILRHENLRLQNLIDKILQSARLEHGQLALSLNSESLHEIIKQTVNNCAFSLMQRNGKLILELNAENDIVEVDKVHIANVIYNLIDNAIKYTSNAPIIKISSFNDPWQRINIIISDNGIGISKEEQKRIFERFYRVHTGDRHDVKGFGLGLNYVKEIIQRHKGTIEVESDIRKGTEFKIYLPLMNSNKKVK